MRPVSWKELRKLCEDVGWVHDRTKGDHYIMTKPGAARPVVLKMAKDLSEDIVLSVARTIGLKRKDILDRLTRTNKGKASAAIIGPPSPPEA